MIRFEHPFLLYLLFLIPVLLLLFILKQVRNKRILKRLGDSELIERLTPNLSKTKPILKFTLMMLAYTFLVLAVANPQMGSKIVKAERKGIDLVVCLDISNSMMAEDIKPNRLARAKQAISRLLDKLQNDRIAIVVFAGSSYIQLPLTNDYSAAKMFLETISPEMIQVQGTAIGGAIEKAMSTLGYEENFADKKWVKKNNRTIIIISDGENHEDDAIGTAKKAAKEDIMVNTIGMGLPEGVPIPLYRNGQRIGYRQDHGGSPITTRLNENMLMQIANAGGGIYVRAANSASAGLDDIIKKISSLDKETFGEQMFADYESRYQYPLALALFFLLLELLILERKNKYFNQSALFGKTGKKKISK